ncbi:MAG: site-2 protease family protein [Candidatus Nanohaloarchaea archaeon]
MTAGIIADISSNLRLYFLIAFVIGVAVYLWFERKKFDRHGIFFVRRTQKGLEEIDRVAKKFPRFWKWYGNLGVVTGVLSMIISTVGIGYAFYEMLATKTVQNGPSLILPGAVSQAKIQPGVSFIPAEYYLVAIAILVTVHELSHGVIARRLDIDLKSIGYGFLAVIPIGFVEPEGDKSMEGEDLSVEAWEIDDWMAKVKVACAGSFANYLTAALFLVLAFGTVSAVTTPSDVYYNAQQGYPAAKAGMDNGTIVQINGQDVDTVDQLRNVTADVKPGDNVTLWTSEGNFTITTVSKEGYDGGYLGILIGRTTVVKEGLDPYTSYLNWLIGLFYMVANLNFLIGLFNMLPIRPLDGGLVMEAVIQRYLGEEKIDYLNKFTLFVWILLLGAILLGIASTFL